MARDPEGIGADVRERLTMGSSFDDATVRAAWATQREFRAELQRAFDQVDVIVTPTLSIFPPRLDEGDDLLVSRCTLPVNLAGVPALSLPVPTGGPLPASIQLVGPGRERGAASGHGRAASRRRSAPVDSARVPAHGRGRSRRGGAAAAMGRRPDVDPTAVEGWAVGQWRSRDQVWSDFACPWCALGFTRLDVALGQFEHADDVTVVHRSFELDPAAPPRRDITMDEALRRKYGMGPEQVEAGHARLTEMGAEVGFAFHFERIQLGNTFDAHRVAQAARGERAGARADRGPLRGVLHRGRLLSDHEVLRDGGALRPAWTRFSSTRCWGASSSAVRYAWTRRRPRSSR